MMYRYEHGWDAGGWVLMLVVLLDDQFQGVGVSDLR
jgi:hypothetical protein